MYYTYAYLREDGTPYYIGKGTRNRIFSNSRIINKPKDEDRIIFLKQNLTEEEAFNHEIYMISVYGRKALGTGILRNLTDGGEGCSGMVCSEKTKEKIRKRAIGRKVSEETKQKLSKIRRGRKHTEEWKKIQSERMKANTYGLGIKPSPETIKKISDKLKGRVMSEEQKKKLSDAHKGKKLTEEHRKNIGKASKGRKHSEETKRKLEEINKNKTFVCNILWTIENIHTKELFEITNLNEWCRTNNLSSGTLNRTQNHLKQYRGYRIISKSFVENSDGKSRTYQQV